MWGQAYCRGGRLNPENPLNSLHPRKSFRDIQKPQKNEDDQDNEFDDEFEEFTFKDNVVKNDNDLGCKIAVNPMLLEKTIDDFTENQNEEQIQVPEELQEVDIKGIHFKMCMPKMGDIKFTVYDYKPNSKLKDLKELTYTSEVRKADALTFYFQGLKLRKNTKLRDIQYSHQKNDKTKPILIYTEDRVFTDFTVNQMKEHFNILVVPKDLQYYESRVPRQKIEFEREKLRKLREVYQVAIDKTQNCRFFVRDFLEYIKKILALQLNVTKMNQEERLFIREKAFAQGRVEGVLFQKIEGIDRALFVVHSVRNIHDIDYELRLLESFLPMQILNNKYRKEIKRAYDITEEFEEEIMNNKIYGVLTDGVEYKFMIGKELFQNSS
eukprot:403368161